MHLLHNDGVGPVPAPAPSGEPTAFHRGLAGYAPTPLIEVPELAAATGIGRAFVKVEEQRFGLPAFKVLGASWAIARLAPPDPAAPPFRPEEDGRIPRELLRSLPALDARVLLLRFEDGLLQKEIADFLGYSETRIGQIVRGAVGEIRQRMGVDW